MKSKKPAQKVLDTVKYLDMVMAEARHRRGLLRQTLAETGWRDDPQDLRFLPGWRLILPRFSGQLVKQPF